MTRVTREEFEELVSKYGLLSDKIHTYWKLQELKKTCADSSFFSVEMKEKITAKCEELSNLICDDIFNH